MHELVDKLEIVEDKINNKFLLRSHLKEFEYSCKTQYVSMKTYKEVIDPSLQQIAQFTDSFASNTELINQVTLE